MNFKFFLRSLRFQKFIINRFATLFLIRVSQLRWQQVGSAILAAFLALAGAAWAFDLPDVLCFNLFGAIYWLFIYLSIYIDFRVYERTKEWIKKRWLFLFKKIKKVFKLERLVFFFPNWFSDK